MEASNYVLKEAVMQLWKYAMKKSKNSHGTLSGLAFAERAYAYYVIWRILRSNDVSEIYDIVFQENGVEME